MNSNWITRIFANGVKHMTKSLEKTEYKSDTLISAIYAKIDFTPWKSNVTISFKKAEIFGIRRDGNTFYGDSNVLLGSGFIGGDGLPFGKFNRLYHHHNSINFGGDAFGGLFETEEVAREAAKQFLEHMKKNMSLPD